MNDNTPQYAEQRFFHADRPRGLRDGMLLTLNEHGRTPFGEHYIREMEACEREERPIMGPLFREYSTEMIRQNHYPSFWSRFSCFFGANYYEEAVRFAQLINPVPDHPVPIFEVYAREFVTLDMNMLDFPPESSDYIPSIHGYWKRVISNHGHPTRRRPPMLEVLMRPPVRVGRQVGEVVFPAL